MVEIRKANDLSPHSGLSLVVAGPPGTGKSWFLGTMAETGPTLLIATLSREVNSVNYQRNNVDVVLLEDLGWMPSLDPPRYEATAFADFLQLINDLYDDDYYKNVIIDSGTELAEAAWHEALKPHGVASPADMEDKRSRWLPYETLDILLDQAIKSAVSLTKLSVKPKNVGIAWHVQPPKDDTYDSSTSTTKKSADHKSEGVEYEGKVLPMIRGRFRRRLAAQVDAYIYTDIKWEVEEGKKAGKKERSANFVVQVSPHQDRHTKLPGPLPAKKFIPNDFSTFMGLIEEIIHHPEGIVVPEEKPVSEPSTTKPAARKPSTSKKKGGTTRKRRLKGS